MNDESVIDLLRNFDDLLVCNFRIEDVEREPNSVFLLLDRLTDPLNSEGDQILVPDRTDRRNDHIVGLPCFTKLSSELFEYQYA